MKGDAERLSRVRTAMEAQQLDAIVCRLPENVLLLSGHWPLNGWSFFVFPRDGEPTCIVPHCDEREAGKELWSGECISFPFGILDAGNPYDHITVALKSTSADNGWLRIGYEGGFETVAPPWNVAEPTISASITHGMLESVYGRETLVDVTDFLLDQRACKTSAEIEKLRKVNEISTFGLKSFFDKVDIGVSGIELVAAVESAIMERGTGYKGAGRVRAFAQVSTGADETALGYRPMEISTIRKMANGDLALLELATVADGFWSDRTRVRVAGKAISQQTNVFAAVINAQNAAIASIRAGVKAGDVDESARSIIRDAGYDKYFFHVTGHGLGFRYHEPTPLICPGGQLTLECGMTHTVEPGVYIAEMGGIRIEDNIVVTEDSAEVLGPWSKDMC